MDCPRHTMIEDRPFTKDRPVTEPDQELGLGGSDDREIRCPLCAWTPSEEDRWACRCRHSWNTFNTGGVCPGCLYQWAYTQCLACHGWSLHSDWYPEARH